MKDKHVLITGHTGFKGAWLTAMLSHQGAKVSGISLDPVPGGIFSEASLHDLLEHDVRLDIRNLENLIETFQRISPDVLIHLAAQPLVLSSYEKPFETYTTNVVGTLNVLEAIRATSSVEASLIITTDKVYRQEPGLKRTFVESDDLGAADPYSTSKAMADLLTQSWIASNPGAKIAIARAGNVIGGGDVAANRLLPDLVRAFISGNKAIVRNPDSVRPWQHVLDCLAGYISLAEGLVSGTADSGAFNFGPVPNSPLRVSEVAAIAATAWGEGASWEARENSQPKESQYLMLDSSKSKTLLNWKEKLSARESISWSVEWAKRVANGSSARNALSEQVKEYVLR